MGPLWPTGLLENHIKMAEWLMVTHLVTLAGPVRGQSRGAEVVLLPQPGAPTWCGAFVCQS